MPPFVVVDLLKLFPQIYNEKRPSGVTGRVILPYTRVTRGSCHRFDPGSSLPGRPRSCPFRQHFESMDSLLVCELHAHSTWSDGHLTLPELVDLHGRAGIDVLCITDHAVRLDDPSRAATSSAQRAASPHPGSGERTSPSAGRAQPRCRRPRLVSSPSERREPSEWISAASTSSRPRMVGSCSRSTALSTSSRTTLSATCTRPRS